MRFPHGRTTIIIETGKVKGKKERHPRGFFLMLPHAYVTGTVPDEGCVVWGNVGERDSARKAGLPVLLKATARLLYELLFLWACYVFVCVCVFQLTQRYVQVCLCVCLHVYVDQNVFKCVCVLCSSLYTVCTCPPLEYANTHCLGQNWANYCFLVFTSQNNLFYSASLLSPFHL